MRRFMENSYKRKRQYVVGIVALLTLAVFLVCNHNDKRVYKVYIEDRLVGVTGESPETIEKTYNEVKAKKYAQGSELILEDITISGSTTDNNQQLVSKDELARRLYVELSDEAETVAAVSMLQGRTLVMQLPMETIYLEDAALYVGESRVISEGREETREITFQKALGEDGETVGRVIGNEVVETSQAKIVAVGIKEKPAYIMPVEDYVYTSAFGPRWGRAHEGVDLAVSTGTSVAASADGVVIQSGWNGGYGISIYVDHGNGIITRYGHLSQAYAQVGRSVGQGEIIGLSGNTGNSTGPHLHFEIRIGDVAVNPGSYVDIEY